MGRRGPPPKPSAIREQDGTAIPKSVAVNEPRYGSAGPPKPSGMGRLAGKIWDQLAGDLEEAGVLRSVDWLAFRNLCEDEALLEDMRAGLKKALAELSRQAKEKQSKIIGNALVHFTNTTGGRRILGSIRELATSCITQRREFGLTPASNTRVESFAPMGGGAGETIDSALDGDESEFYHAPELVQ